jgi:hypothetical protein
VSGQSHDTTSLRARQLADSARDLEAVHARQTDVQENHLGLERRYYSERVRAVRDDGGLVTPALEQKGQAFCRCRLVFHDQDAKRE